MTSNPRPARPTIYDVAREAGVSKSLVSLVLNGSALVSAAKREAVNEAIAKLATAPARPRPTWPPTAPRPSAW
ncbi:MAG: LacI family DNA-binding transcriptional regulator [Micropruina sp.]|nr:LacI family DNA-binding transcriptional regulator [Micropruina sp.]